VRWWMRECGRRCRATSALSEPARLWRSVYFLPAEPEWRAGAGPCAALHERAPLRFRASTTVTLCWPAHVLAEAGWDAMFVLYLL